MQNVTVPFVSSVIAMSSMFSSVSWKRRLDSLSAACASLRSVMSRIIARRLPSGIVVAITSAAKTDPSLRRSCHSR